MRKERGITLIALVVTIVVLLILAVVSINVVFGDDGIFGTAKQAANQTANAAHFEANILGTELQTFVDQAVNGTGENGGGTTPETPNPTPTPDPTNPTLVSKVSVGDFVDYDAVLTKWSTTVASPTTTGTFGGYTQDTYKGTSVNSYTDTNGTTYKTTTSGWRVLSVDAATGVVKITTAGVPAQGYYGNSDSDRTAMISAMDTFANSNFVASGYATGAVNMKKTDTDSLGSNEDLQRNGSSYWLGTALTTYDSDGNYRLYAVDGNGGGVGYKFNSAYGVRPIVTLTTGLLTNDTKSTDVHGNSAWELILPE